MTARCVASSPSCVNSWVGVDIDQAMLSLSTYVGHAMVTNTYWYLSAVPELMALAAGRFESFLPQLEVAYE